MQRTAEQPARSAAADLPQQREVLIAVALATSLLSRGRSCVLLPVICRDRCLGHQLPGVLGLRHHQFRLLIGISHAGTLISAILRLTNATWRRPVTRCAEAITVFSVLIGAIIPICHIGRPWLGFWMIPYHSERGIWPNFRSPLAWDFFAIATYLTGSSIFLLLPTIPDFAAVRDTATGLRKKIIA